MDPVYPEHVAIEVALDGLEEGVWTELTNATADGNDVSKTGGSPDIWDASADLTREILAGESYVTTIVDETNLTRRFGLTNDDGSFLLELKSNGELWCVEDTVKLCDYSSDDVIRIAIEEGEVNYYVNDVLEHTSSGIPTYPLTVQATFYSSSATIKAVEIAGAVSGEAGAPIYTELQDVQLAPEISISRGIRGTTIADRVANAGTLSFALDNSEDNSQGKLGLYSLNHENKMQGWRYGIPVRCRVTFLEVPETVFVGTIVGIQPMSGKYKNRKVSVFCADWMEEAASAKVTGIPIQVDKRSNEVFQTLLEAVDRQPVGTLIGFGGDVYPYSLDNALDEEVNVMSEFQRLLVSELGYTFTARDGIQVFQGRHRRPNLFTLSETLTDEDIDAVDTSRGREEIVNKAQIQVHPRRVDSAATTVLFDYATSQRVERGTSITINGLYRDPDAKATRVGGISMVDPLVASTDYTFNTEEDGSGLDITAQLTVDADFGGNSVVITITNNGPRDGYITKLQCRGKGVYDYETVLVTADSEASKALYGENAFALDMPYQSDLSVAEDAANYIVTNCKSLLTQVRSVTFIANREERLMRSALQLDISARVKVTETVTGTAGVIPVGETSPVTVTEFFINAIDITIGENGILRCTWLLAPADAYTYWILERDGFTELDETTRLGYGSFITGWVVDESELGITTRVNP